MSKDSRAAGPRGRTGLVSTLNALLAVATAGFAATAAAQQPGAKASYDKLCAACHGATGGGDGPVAAALTPRPASFADSSIAKRSDEELARAIAEGKPPMPPFGKQVNASQVKALVAYVRELGKKPK